ncbi:MAG: signal recognition particle-docking protein FtsY [Pseudomonadota bacterium]
MTFNWFKKKKEEEEKTPVTEAPAEPPEQPTPAPEPTENKQGFFKRLKVKLSKTRKTLVSRMDRLFLGKKEIDGELLEELEEILITSDIGVKAAMELIENVREKVARKLLNNPEQLKGALVDEIMGFLQSPPAPPRITHQKPYVIMVVGVNGVGKTTTIGKIAARYKKEGKDVLLIAGDTFRAAAIEQLEIWGERVGADVIRQKSGSDPSAVVFDGIEAAQARNIDVVIIDTAGRLHTKINLMKELQKVHRVISRKCPDAPHEVLLVLDATTGQNAISQAQVFHEAINITGIALTKLDGTAKGGIAVGICNELKIPLQYIGIGEQIEDLQDFDAKEFVNALFTL